MPLHDDPFRMLGLDCTATEEDLRRAYRLAARTYHPDIWRGDPDEGRRRFHEVVRAHRCAAAAIRRRRSGRHGRPATWQPQDFSRLHDQTLRGFTRAPQNMPEKALRTLPGARRFSYASLNEPRAFIALWLLSILATMTGAALLVRDARVARMLHETGSVGWIALATAPVVVYGALLALGVLAILLTRRVVWLVSQIGWLARRALPGSSKLPSNQDTSRLP